MNPPTTRAGPLSDTFLQQRGAMLDLVERLYDPVSNSQSVVFGTIGRADIDFRRHSCK